MVDRVIIIVMDSAGVGSMPDACDYNDCDVNTIGHIYETLGSLDIPNLLSLGLGELTNVGESNVKQYRGSYGKMREVSPGKDTTTGHWEMMGVPLDFSFPTYPEGFPSSIIKEFEQRTGRKTLGNYPQSGTVILEELGEEHYKTGALIVYTSADSVFQIAAHEEVVPLEELYEYCETARGILKGEHAVGRVIARPFTGKPGSFERDNAARRDYSLPPPEETLLDILKSKGFMVAGIGKIPDIFAHRGLTQEIHTDDNMDGVDKTVETIRETSDRRGLIFTNLVEFDSVYGHRRDIKGYARALEDFDRRLPEVFENMSGRDVLIVTADHGCDPTHVQHTDHTREYVPLLVYGKGLTVGVNLGIRQGFSDCGQTVADFLGAGSLKNGTSFRDMLISE